MTLTNYNGFKVTNPNLFMLELAQLKNEIANNYSDKKLRETFILWALLKNNTINTFNTKIDSLKLFSKFKTEFERNKKQHILPYDNPYDLCLNFFPEYNVGYTICENNELHQRLLKFKSIEEYSYSIMSDKPKNISDKEWADRKNIWEKAQTKTSNQSFTDAISIIVFEECVHSSIIFNNQSTIENVLEKYIDQTSYQYMIQNYGSDEDKKLLRKISISLKGDEPKPRLLDLHARMMELHSQYKDDYFEKWIQKYQSQKKDENK